MRNRRKRNCIKMICSWYDGPWVSKPKLNCLQFPPHHYMTKPQLPHNDNSLAGYFTCLQIFNRSKPHTPPLLLLYHTSHSLSLSLTWSTKSEKKGIRRGIRPFCSHEKSMFNHSFSYSSLIAPCIATEKACQLPKKGLFCLIWLELSFLGSRVSHSDQSLFPS